MVDTATVTPLALCLPCFTRSARNRVAIWEECRQKYGRKGPFLFGHFTIADAMYAPIVWRFLTYHVELPEASRQWVETMAALPAMQEWRAGALAESD